MEQWSANGALLPIAVSRTVQLARVLRLSKLLKNAKGLQTIVAALNEGLKSIVFIFLLLFIVFMMYATAGTIYMGMNDPVGPLCTARWCSCILLLTFAFATIRNSVAFWNRLCVIRDAIRPPDDE
jgi:hypothetical protein